jgi:hypothetical protein
VSNNVIKKFFAALDAAKQNAGEVAREFVQTVASRAVPGGSAAGYLLPLTHRAYIAVAALDEGLVGTPDYLGLAYWWSHEYKYTLRDATPTQRKAAHDAILAAGLDLDGVSKQHEAIITKACTRRKKAGQAQ